MLKCAPANVLRFVPKPEQTMIKFASVNGEIVPADSACLGITDLGFLRGYGMFDFLLIKNGQPLFVEDYLDRFWRSAHQLKLKVPLDREQLIAHIHQLIGSNGLADASIRLVLTGGYASDGYSPSENANLVILEHEYPTCHPDKYEKGISLLLHEYQRQFPAIKTTNYVVGILMREQLQKAGADDLLFYQNGFITETTRANFFIVTPEGGIVTAGEGILEGITRKHTLMLARKHYQVEMRQPEVEELKTAKEAFITSSTKRVMPVVQVSDIVIGNGKPGPVSAHLLELLKEAETAYLQNDARVS